jgi:DNA-binding transcriptional ArsR family regulator
MDKIFKALADINRRKILTLLKNKEMSVNDLLKGFEITQATLSNHLSILRKAKLVEFKILGKQRIYRLNIEVLKTLVSNLSNFTGTTVQKEISEIEIRGRR